MMNYTAYSNADGAIAYFGRAGSELERAGEWRGGDAGHLGLAGRVDLADWRHAVRGKGPGGEKLCQRERADRRCLHDITFSANKSTSVLRALVDDSVREVIETANAATMDLVERKMTTRVKGLFRQEMVATGGMVSASFYHDITRGRDPGDHIHNTVMNATRHRGKWYAPEMKPVVESSAFLAAHFHNEVARGLRERGYRVERTKDNFRVVGVPDSACRKLSSRRGDIDREQARRQAALSEQIGGCADAGKLRELEARLEHVKSPKGRAALAVLSREKKADSLDPARLKAGWEAKLTPYERKTLAETRQEAADAIPAPPAMRDAHHLANAFAGLMEAHSRVTEERLLTEALKIGVGEVTLPGLQAALREMTTCETVPKGHIRHYRADAIAPVEHPEWVRQGMIESGQAEAEGRWFTADKGALAWYLDDRGGNSRAYFVDIPEANLGKYRVSNCTEQFGRRPVRSFSRDPENEFFLPRDLADSMRPLIAGVVRAAGMVSTRDNLDKEAEIERLAKRGQIAWLPKSTPEDLAGRLKAVQAGRDPSVIQGDKLTFGEFHRLSQSANSESRKLVVVGNRPKNMPPGHPLAVLERAGVRPFGETPRAKRPKVVSVLPQIKGWGARVKKHLERVRRAAWFPTHQPERTPHVERQREAAGGWQR